jgi:hypothetical protein
MLNDTVKELQEFLADQSIEDEEEDEAASLADALGNVDLDDEFAFDAQLSRHERTLFESGVKLLSMLAAMLKRGVQTLQQLREEPSKPMLQWTARLDGHYARVQDSIVDMGAALYPPVDVEELSEAVDAVEQAGVALLVSLRDQPEISETSDGELCTGQRAFERQVALVKTHVAAQQAQS